jgi:predicted lipoprotein with Yx(FWY)xxD motif
MNIKAFVATTALALVFTSSMALAQMAPAKTMDTPKGKVMANSAGMTLYTYDKDAAGKSACNGPCAGNWSPLVATASDKPSGDWTIVTRDDGSTMWAYKGKPLYTWKNDKAPGDTTGDGAANGAWHMAAP